MPLPEITRCDIEMSSSENDITSEKWIKISSHKNPVLGALLGRVVSEVVLQSGDPGSNSGGSTTGLFFLLDILLSFSWPVSGVVRFGSHLKALPTSYRRLTLIRRPHPQNDIQCVYEDVNTN